MLKGVVEVEKRLLNANLVYSSTIVIVLMKGLKLRLVS
jgi:hypothetical protein